MFMKNFHLALPLILLLLNACTTVPPAPQEPPVTPEAKPAQPVPPVQAVEPVLPKPQTETPPTTRTPPLPKKVAPAPAASPAVLALMQEAEENSASGSLDEAAATLERAIRLQPRNAELWHKLAEVRLKQFQPGLAEDLAKKSNILAQDNKALVRQNWALIADARRKKGDAEGAAQADAKAGR
jgi:tetratricopeptide (TPR) repeat protein